MKILRALAVLGCLAIPFTHASAADYAPLNCAAAGSPSEKTICSNYELGQLEARMATLYQWSTSFVGMGQRGDMQDAQRAFLKERANCGANVGCLSGAYDKRIAQLQSVMENVRGKGPF